MTRIKLRSLVWDKYNREHIRKHSVTIKEVRIALKRVVADKKGYGGRIILLGRSGSRILAAIMAKEKSEKYYVVTARDADKRERKIVYDKEKNK